MSGERCMVAHEVTTETGAGMSGERCMVAREVTTELQVRA